MYFAGTDEYFTILMEIRQLQKDQKRLEKLLKKHDISIPRSKGTD